MCSEEDAGAEFFDEFDGFWGMRFPQSGACGDEDGVSSSSHRCSCKDLRVLQYECNKLTNLSLYVLSIILWYYTHLSIICVNLWFWDTYEMHSVFSENGCDTSSDRGWSGHLTLGCTTGTTPGLALELLGRRGTYAFRCNSTFTMILYKLFASTRGLWYDLVIMLTLINLLFLKKVKSVLKMKN
jgi:hypothetical protein